MSSLKYIGISHPDPAGNPSLLVENSARFGQRFDGKDLTLLLRMYQGRRITIQIDVSPVEGPDAHCS